MMKDDGYSRSTQPRSPRRPLFRPIIPPSISMIIYALAPDVNLVGLRRQLLGTDAVAMAIINHVISVAQHRDSIRRYGWRDYVRNTWRAARAGCRC
jgi:TRAP-type C4-dicarboxylate transport system permease large subunit